LQLFFARKKHAILKDKKNEKLWRKIIKQKMDKNNKALATVILKPQSFKLT
jgi:hypothetical protein